MQYNSVDETLAQLGMAPNREPGRRALRQPVRSMTEAAERPHPIPRYAWVVFALTFGLLISDYMARQVLNAVFPLLKAEWALSDGQLGLLSGVVAIMVGLLTFPLSLLADRWGRVSSLTAMAVLWSLATLLCGIAGNYEQMLAGRVLVGVGEAAYGSVGIAVVVSVFPKRLRATLVRRIHGRRTCSARCWGSASAARLPRPMAGEWLSSPSRWPASLLAMLYPLLVGEQRLKRLAEATKPALRARSQGVPEASSCLPAGR